ncbi:E3 ubiquitin-protein ligase RBBP6-like [Bombus vosnesenskii]|uniref:E3 ubiquitin-protein ligase RBBP6-like n=1 Tax=Bombus vosnesenskii TaxID=207650 RepID=A0A6J3KSQ5_9HYME|nr:E3 ubiquitin-protein ligase RBBP6-like [Bombus vosnesenskii]
MPRDDEIKVQIFDGRDYKMWKKRILMYLKCKKCYEPVTREKMDTDAQDKWDEKNQWAMNYIYSSIANEQLEFVGDQDTALKIMQKFDEMYMKESTAVQICIRSRLDMMSAGANVSEREKLDYMLKALPESLNYIGDLIDSVKESDQTCEFLKNKIIIAMAVESTVTWQKIAQTRIEAETMAQTMEERNGKEVRIRRSRIGVAADEVLAKEDEDTANEDLANEDKAEAGNNATTRQNPEPKVLEVEPNREARKSVNVTINVGRNERNVEITEPVKKAKLDRTKFKPVPETYSPTRLSAKERLGEKVDENKERKISPIKSFLDRREMKSENQSRSRSPRSTRDKRISSLLDRRVDSSLTIPGSERKVFLDDRKRDNKDRGDLSKEGNDFRSERHDIRSERDPRIDSRGDFRSTRNDSKGERIDKDREKDRAKERRGRTSSCTFKRNDIPKIGLLKSREEEDDGRRDKKTKEDKKRKKEHRSRSKSKEHKKRKEKKHKKDNEKNLEKKQKHKENIGLKDKPESNETKINYENPEPPATESIKKQRKNPRLVSDRKRSMLDEASFEPDYSASDSESDGEDGKVVSLPTKKLKLDEPDIEKEMDIKSLKKRSKSTSSEDSSSTSDSSTTDSDNSDKKKKKKHKKHKKKKSMKKDSSSDSDSYSDSSETSTDEEKHKKKTKKSKMSVVCTRLNSQFGNASVAPSRL